MGKIVGLGAPGKMGAPADSKLTAKVTELEAANAKLAKQ